MPAGPTEVLILATGGSPRYIAADFLAQAEHDPDAVALLVTPSPRLAKAVAAEVEKQLRDLPKTNPAGNRCNSPAPFWLRLRSTRPFDLQIAWPRNT